MGRSLFLLILAAASVRADEGPKIDRTVGKQPKYAGTPKYLLLTFDADAKERVWLVHDGGTLYADRNGDGDLTGDGEKVAADKVRGKPADLDAGYTFDVGDVTVGGKTHKGLTVSAEKLSRYADGDVGKLPEVQAALKKDPKALVYTVQVQAERPGVTGGGAGGRVAYLVGPLDLVGVLRFAESPAAAPVVRVGGRLEVSFYADRPTLRVGRGSEFMTVVGAPGVGPGTFAMVGYTDTVPKDAKPVAEVTFPAAKFGDPPVTKRFELPERC